MSEIVKQKIKETYGQAKDALFKKVGLLIGQINNCYGNVRTFPRRFHNAGNALIGNECHPRKSKGKIK